MVTGMCACMRALVIIETTRFNVVSRRSFCDVFCCYYYYQVGQEMTQTPIGDHRFWAAAAVRDKVQRDVAGHLHLLTVSDTFLLLSTTNLCTIKVNVVGDLIRSLV